MLDMACAETYNWMLSGFNADNGAALEKLITKHHVNLVRFPAEVLAQLRTMAYETLDEIAAKDKQAGKVHAAFKKFQKQVGVWGEVSEKAYYDVIAEKFSLKS